MNRIRKQKRKRKKRKENKKKGLGEPFGPVRRNSPRPANSN
jgi:hypothetical protein